MNLSYNRGDDKDCVTENYRRICKSIGVRIEDVVFSDQVHDTQIHVAKREDCQGTDYGHRKLVNIDGPKELIGNIVSVKIIDTKSFSMDGVYIKD